MSLELSFSSCGRAVNEAVLRNSVISTLEKVLKHQGCVYGECVRLLKGDTLRKSQRQRVAVLNYTTQDRIIALTKMLNRVKDGKATIDEMLAVSDAHWFSGTTFPINALRIGE